MILTFMNIFLKNKLSQISWKFFFLKGKNFKFNENDNSKLEINDENAETLNLSKLEDKIPLVFDYEINNTKLDENDSSNIKLIYFDENLNNKNQ